MNVCPCILKSGVKHLLAWNIVLGPPFKSHCSNSLVWKDAYYNTNVKENNIKESKEDSCTCDYNKQESLLSSREVSIPNNWPDERICQKHRLNGLDCRLAGLISMGIQNFVLWLFCLLKLSYLFLWWLCYVESHPCSKHLLHYGKGGVMVVIWVIGFLIE